jgi:two-component system, NarL family, response regulator YdfI
VTRVLVVARSPAVRAGLTALLSGQPGFTLLESSMAPASLGDAADAVEADVILLALEPGESPFSPIQPGPDRAARVPAVVVLGEDPAQAWAGRALRSGARGALARTATAEQIVAAVTAAAAGLMVREPASARSTETSSAVPVTPIQSLTPREIEIAGLLAEGLGNKGIATRLGISEHTVKTHLGSLFAKLQVSSRAEAVASAARLGLIML